VATFLGGGRQKDRELNNNRATWISWDINPTAPIRSPFRGLFIFGLFQQAINS
jgi:hypothetical protein